MLLAQFNIGILRYDWDDPKMSDFARNLDRIYALAARSSGYVWHLDPETMDAEQLDRDGSLGGNPRIASTLSVWKDLESLSAFTFKTAHNAFYERRAEWYDDADQGWGGHRLVMWWIAPEHRPSVAEGVERLTRLWREGPSEDAFSWPSSQRESV